MKVVLTQQQRTVLLRTIARYAPPVERVDAYGSRANGTARPGSDIDLVLAGDIDRTMLACISATLDGSYLSISADVKAYDLLGEDGLRDQGLTTAIPLFDRAELIAARAASARTA